MRDDEDEAERGVHTVPTVPPPPGEDDVYDAKTQVGGLTAEALAMLRQVRDERPLPAGLNEEANVPVFEDEENLPGPAPRIVPAAGRPAVARPPAAVTPAAAPVSSPAPRASSPAVAPRAPASRPSHPGLIGQGITAQVALSGAAIRAAFSAPDASGATPRVPAAAETATPNAPAMTEPSTSASSGIRRAAVVEAPAPPVVMPVTTSAQRELAPLFDADEPDPDEPPPSYVAVFGPGSGDGPAAAQRASVPTRRRSRGLLIVTTVIVVLLTVVLLGEAGWITGVIPGRTSPNPPPVVQP